MIGYIEITGAPLETIVRAAYAPSTPRGLGHLHFQDGDLTDDEVSEIVGRFASSSMTAVGMDYVKGRSVKMTVRKDADGRLWIKNRWYDHGDGQLRSFLKAIGIPEERLDTSRAEEEVHIQGCIDEAKALLEKSGGTAQIPWNTEFTRVDEGLAWGAERGLFQRAWGENADTWSLISEEVQHD